MECYKIQNRRYLGSKTRLLSFIEDIIISECPNCKSLFDVFGGTGVVSAYFNSSYDIFINDILASNEYVYKAFLGQGRVNEKKIYEFIDKMNTAEVKQENYYSRNFSDTYLSRKNMKKVGYIRDEIDRLFLSKHINEREKAVLITSLIYSIDRIANTVGHYDAYRKGGDLDKPLVLYPLSLNNISFNKGNKIFRTDSNELAKIIHSDIAYIDPPYNSRQYADAYHFLENVARNEKPAVEGVARKMDRSRLKSKYNTKSAPQAFDELIQSLNVKYILVSYNNTGEKGNSRSNAKISDDEILSSLRKRGAVKVYEKDFATFTTGKTNLDNHKERIFLCKVGNFDDSLFKFNHNRIKIQSPLNYTGGKFKLLPQLEEKFPSDAEIFYDIFCGGTNVGANVEYSTIKCVDNNPHLINLLNYLKSHDYYFVNSALEDAIQKYNLSETSKYGYEYYESDSSKGVGKYNANNYAKLRLDYNTSEQKDPLLFLLLIMFGFNNQIRFNSKGEFNLPVGKRDYNHSLRKKLQGFIANIHSCDIEFRCMDFEKVLEDDIVPEKTFLYLDPPYSLGLATYNENGGWSEKEDLRLFKFLDICNKLHIRFALSNVIEHKGGRNETLLNWCLNNHYNINYLNYSYGNSSYHKNDRNSITKEVLITNY